MYYLFWSLDFLFWLSTNTFVPTLLTRWRNNVHRPHYVIYVIVQFPLSKIPLCIDPYKIKSQSSTLRYGFYTEMTVLLMCVVAELRRYSTQRDRMTAKVLITKTKTKLLQRLHLATPGLITLRTHCYEEIQGVGRECLRLRCGVQIITIIIDLFCAMEVIWSAAGLIKHFFVVTSVELITNILNKKN